jgi:hypothetical protein
MLSCSYRVYSQGDMQTPQPPPIEPTLFNPWPCFIAASEQSSSSILLLLHTFLSKYYAAGRPKAVAT